MLKFKLRVDSAHTGINAYDLIPAMSDLVIFITYPSLIQRHNAESLKHKNYEYNIQIEYIGISPKIFCFLDWKLNNVFLLGYDNLKLRGPSHLLRK